MVEHTVAATNANEYSDALAFKTVELVFKYLPKVVENPDNMEYREKLHIAGDMGGIAFSNSGVGLAHAIGHSLGPLLGIPHGISVGIPLPCVVEFNRGDERADKKYKLLEKHLKNILDVEERLEEAILSLYQNIGFPKSYMEYGVKEEELRKNLDTIVLRIFEDPVLAFAPRPPTEDEAKELVEKAFKGC